MQWQEKWGKEYKKIRKMTMTNQEWKGGKRKYKKKRMHRNKIKKEKNDEKEERKKV